MVVPAYPTVCTVMRLHVLRYPIRRFAIVSPTNRAGVRGRRCGETVKRLSAIILPAYRVRLREWRRGETV